MIRRRISHGSRGKTWERYLDQLHSEYIDSGIAAVTRNHPEIHQRSVITSKGTFTASYGKPAAVDYRIDAAGWSLVYDAKECRGVSFPWPNLHAHQAMYLDQCEAQSGSLVALILFHDAKQHVGLVVPWATIREGYYIWLDHHTDPSGVPLKRGLGSIRFDELRKRAVYCGSTAPFFGDRFDYLRAVLRWLSDLGPRREYRRQVAFDIEDRISRMRPFVGPLDLAMEE